MKQIISALLLLLTASISQSATYTHDGPEENSCYVVFTTHWTGQTYDTQYREENWSRTTPQPYCYSNTHYVPPTSTLQGFSLEEHTDFYSAGGYLDAQCVTQTGKTTFWWSQTPPSFPLTSPLQWPGDHIGTDGYILNFTGQNFPGGGSATMDGLVNESKRFRFSSTTPTSPNNVKFIVVAWDYNVSTGATTIINPANSTFYINNLACDSSGYKTFVWYGENDWHSLTVSVAGHPNIYYTVNLVSIQ